MGVENKIMGVIIDIPEGEVQWGAMMGYSALEWTALLVSMILGTSF